MKQLYRRTRVLMGTPLELTVVGAERDCSDLFEAVFDEVTRIEQIFTIYRPNSPLSRLNQTSKKGICYRLDREIIEIISRSIDYAERSCGAFDPTSGPLVDLWGFGVSERMDVPPSKEDIRSRCNSVGYSNLKIVPYKDQVVFLKDGMTLNLGGIVKGYAIDRAVQILKDHGIHQGLVNFGSSLYALGSPPGKSGWRIAIQHPRQETGEIESVLLFNQALSTSGDYERCFFYEGKRFSHLIDPRSGNPVSGMAGVSVIASSAIDADVFSTAAFILGRYNGNKFLEDLPDVSGLIVSENSSGALDSRTTGGWGKFSSGRAIARRRFIAMMGVALVGLFLPSKSEGAVIRFATEKEALKRIIPDADRYDSERVRLTGAQHSEVQSLIGVGFRKREYQFWIGRKGKGAIGYAVLLNVIGKKRPITFLIGIDPAGKVKGVEVLIYRESKGSEVRYERFMSQFFGKKNGDPLRLGQDVRPISGATLSSRAATYAVRKGLAIFEVVYKRR